MEKRQLSPAFRTLAKCCAGLSIIIASYPHIFLIEHSGGLPDPMSDAVAKLFTHTHLGCGTFLFFMVGYLFTYSSFGRAKTIWPIIGAISLIISALGLFFGLVPLAIIATIIFTISIIVMSIGIIGWV